MKHLEMTLRNNISDFNTLIYKLEVFFKENNISNILMPTTLILEELFTNTITHG
ncbi:MAG: Anti-sigma regulatory factor, partial [Bacteroidota bacterium]